MSRSTFSILPYINRQKVKADGTANILCRITVDGKSAAISTGISCTPSEWNAKKGEVRNARDNGRLASFLAEVKDKYNSLLTTNGIITVEMLKAVLKDKVQHILYRQSYQGSNNHPSRTLIPLVLPSYMQMRECYDEGIDEHEYKTCKLK